MGTALSNCCYQEEYGQHFTTKGARRVVRRFERRGLRRTERELVEAVTAAGIDDCTVLEVGGGVGQLQAHLLRNGARRTTNVDLSGSWEGPAARLFASLGLEDRTERYVGDFVDLADELPPADVVVLHAVVCCYSDWEALIDAAIARSSRVLALTLPRDAWLSWTITVPGNLYMAARGCAFRAFIHPVDELLATVRRGGFEVSYDRSHLIWRTLVLVRR